MQVLIISKWLNYIHVKIQSYGEGLANLNIVIQQQVTYSNNAALAVKRSLYLTQSTKLEELLAKNEKFDVVLAMEIIEHVNQPLEFLRTCANLVRPGGDLFLSTMSRTPAAYALTVFLAEKVLGMVHEGTHDWSKYIKSKELIEAIESFGEEWDVTDVRGISWDPLDRKWKVTDKNGLIGYGGFETLEINYILRATKKLAQ